MDIDEPSRMAGLVKNKNLIMKSFFTKWGLTISLVIIIIHFLAQFLGEEYKLVENISKGLFLPSLMMYLYFQPNVYNKPGKNLVMLGLLGSFFGDVLLGFCWFIYFQLSTAIGPLIYPILVYMALICSAALMAIHIANHKPIKIIANNFWIPGMLFFIASDAILAFNKFDWAINDPIDNIGLVVMFTYGLAQFLLVKGFQMYFTTKLVDTKA
ncbi:MAG: lysoplasmalogenase [Sediminibacterium sp.]|nr:lysoplasmalogenase [Sediminibacterium sp.]